MSKKTRVRKVNIVVSILDKYGRKKDIFELINDVSETLKNTIPELHPDNRPKDWRYETDLNKRCVTSLIRGTVQIVGTNFLASYLVGKRRRLSGHEGGAYRVDLNSERGDFVYDS